MQEQYKADRQSRSLPEKGTNRMISIIVPVYNAGDYIIQTIEMVRRQTYTDWELILVDDASRDQSVQVIREELADNPDERIRLICKEQNEGAAKARNTGIMYAHGRYLAYLDADDVWKADKLEKELRFMQEKNVGFVFTAYEFGDEQANGTGKIVHVPETLDYKKALSRTVIFTTTVLFDTEKIPKDLIRMPDVKSEDTATWWQILRNGYTAYGLDEVTAIYRRPAHSLSSNKAEAVKRIWNLYRKVEHLGFFQSSRYFCLWALRATLRRI